MKRQLLIIVMLPVCSFILFAYGKHASFVKSKKGLHNSTIDTTKKENMNSLVVAYKLKTDAKVGPPDEDAIISNQVEANNISAYLRHSINDANGNPVNGYMLQPGDLQSLIAVPNIKNIYLEFGINDSSVTSAGQKIYSYTIMLVPVDANKRPISTTPGYTAYDVICPCVNHVGCCPQN